MRSREFITESRAHPCIVVDVQPEYCGIADGDENPVCVEVIKFVANQTGPVLMFVNAEDQGLSGDTIQDIKLYWEDTLREISGDPEDPAPINWSRFKVVDKGYGYFRSYMDQGVSPAAMIRLIRYLYQNRLNDSRDLDQEVLQQLMGSEYQEWMVDEPFSVNWTSVAQLKGFNGAYIMGGGRNECLREVEILMNAFNIKYRRIDQLVYG